MLIQLSAGKSEMIEDILQQSLGILAVRSPERAARRLTWYFLADDARDETCLNCYPFRFLRLLGDYQSAELSLLILVACSKTPTFGLLFLL